MWILEFLSTTIVHLLVLISALGLLILPLLNAIPFFVTYKTAAQYILIAVLTFGVFTEGAISNNRIWETKVANAKVEAAKKEVKAAEKTVEVVGKVVEKIKVVKEKQDALIIKVPVYITEKADSECNISNSTVQLFDHSATNTVPGDAEAIQEGSSDVRMSEMQKVIIKNNKQYYTLKEEYEGLYQWCEAQGKIANGK